MYVSLFGLGASKRRQRTGFFHLFVWILFVWIVALLFLPTAASTAHLHAQAPDAVAAVPSFVIQIDPALDRVALDAALAEQGFQGGRIWPAFALAEVRPFAAAARLQSADASSLAVMQSTLDALPGVLGTELDGRIQAAGKLPLHPSTLLQPGPVSSVSTIPNDSLNANQWVHNRLGVYESWAISRGDPSVTIAVIDSGYAVTHEDISVDSLWTNRVERDGLPQVDDDGNGFVDDHHGWDWVENDSVTNDPYGHGTHVGGTIAAVTDNALGISGLGPSLTILPLRVLDDQGSGQVSDLIDALYYAFQQEIPVINMSLVLFVDSPALRTAIQALVAQDTVLVAAAGNQSSSVSWPAKYDEVIAVASTDRHDLRSAFSNYGPEIDVAAPGSDILGPYRDNSYMTLSGTSMAAAHVSALAGLVRSLRPDLDASALRALLRAAAQDTNDDFIPGVDDYLGAGRIDFLAALTQAATGLDLRPLSADPLTTFIDASTTVPVVVVPAAADAATKGPAIVGAVVHYELFASAGPDVSPVRVAAGRAITAEDGQAMLTFAAPSPAGSYQLVLTLGQRVFHLDVHVLERPIALTLAGAQRTVTAGGESVPLQLELRNEAGQPLTEAITLHLDTDLGQFENGLMQTDVDVVDGEASVHFHPGQTAGLATVTARLGSVTRVLRLEIAPAQAARIGLRSSVEPVANWVESTSASISFSIVDVFGNPVADGTPVRLVADRGLLSEDRLVSSAGAVVTTFTAPAGVSGPAHIWALVPGTAAETQVDVQLMSYGYCLPMIAGN